MKKLLAILFVVLPFLSPAQPKEIILNGVLEVNSGEKFPYRIVITESGGVVKGHSYTYKEPYDTKATITGTLDRLGHSLQFKEKDIVYSHGFRTKAFMCLIDAALDYDSRHDVLSGPITSTEKDNTACTGGRIIFSNPEEIQNLFSYHDAFDTVINMKKKPKPTVTIVEVKPEQEEKNIPVDKVTTGSERVYDWHSDTVVIDIWDGGRVDGDKVSMLYNKKTLLAGYTLIKEKKQFRIPVSGKGIDVITIIADNEGSEPPNTANIMLTDGAVKYNILAYNKANKEAVIKIRKAK